MCRSLVRLIILLLFRHGSWVFPVPQLEEPRHDHLGSRSGKFPIGQPPRLSESHLQVASDQAFRRSGRRPQVFRRWRHHCCRVEWTIWACGWVGSHTRRVGMSEPPRMNPLRMSETRFRSSPLHLRARSADFRHRLTLHHLPPVARRTTLRTDTNAVCVLLHGEPSNRRGAARSSTAERDARPCSLCCV